MNLFKTIKEKTKKATDLIYTPSLETKLECSKVLKKTSKKLTGSLSIGAPNKTKVSSISYLLIEAVDPIIGKSKDKADILSDESNKKSFTLQAEKEKVVKIDLPIHFANEHKAHDVGGDMKLLNQMSERSRKTAVNYILEIVITYTPDEGEEKTKKIKHEIRFE